MPRNRAFTETSEPQAEPVQTTILEVPATDPQKNFIRNLVAERDLFTGKLSDTPDDQRPAVLESVVAKIDTISKKAASKWIEQLLTLPKLETSAPAASVGSLPDVPAGRYAITGNDGTTDFYKVDRPTEGRWAGKTFVKLLVGPEEQRVSYANTKAVLDRILEAGVQESMLRYGIEIGECGHCGRRLTNEESRAVGIGPICRQHMGW